MDDATSAELANLRARAYGPGADISADPAAMARLQQLEDAARGRTASAGSSLASASVATSAPAPAATAVSARPVRPARDPFAPVPPTPPLPEQPRLAEESAGSERAPIADAAPAVPRSRRRLTRVLWPVSILAAIVITAGVTGGIVAGYVAGSASSSDGQVATLHLSTAVPVQDIFGGSGADVAGALFHGLTIVRSPGVFGSGDVQCLTVYETPSAGADPNSIEGRISYGCAAGALPALVRVGVDFASPQTLRDAFPTGTGLQFVLQDDHVRVTADESGADSAS